jgi:hypothetical protein
LIALTVSASLHALYGASSQIKWDCYIYVKVEVPDIFHLQDSNHFFLLFCGSDRLALPVSLGQPNFDCTAEPSRRYTGRQGDCFFLGFRFKDEGVTA